MATDWVRVRLKRLLLRASGLQVRMTVSYTLTTLVAMLLIELLLGTLIWLELNYGGLADDEFITAARGTAQLYALESAIQAGGNTLDPRTTFEPNQPFSIALADKASPNHPAQITYLATAASGSQEVTFALLLTPTGQVLASSYPARYPTQKPAADLLPEHAEAITGALTGVAANGARLTSQGRTVWAIEPIWNQDRQPIGAIYLQIPVSQELAGGQLVPGFAGMLLASSLFWLVMMLPVGGLFGFITTRGLLHRLRNLVTATTRSADGDYTQRVPVSRRDEVGQLEARFNRMAEQLVGSIAQQQGLAEENARLSERNRIARDLHDSVKQQVFAISMQLGAALATLDQQPEVGRQHLLEADSLAYHAQEELTTLIQELRPLALQNKGLAAALQEYSQTWALRRSIAAGLEIATACDLPPDVEEALWRVAQESFANIARHSQATKVHVTLACHQGIVTLSITDNGQGFESAFVNESSVGLHSMKERMEALGGMLTVESKVGQGTRILAQCRCRESDGYPAGEEG